MRLWHKHKWSSWKDNGKVAYYREGHVGEARWRTREAEEQIRWCEDCGKRQRRET